MFLLGSSTITVRYYKEFDVFID